MFAFVRFQEQKPLESSKKAEHLKVSQKPVWYGANLRPLISIFTENLIFFWIEHLLSYDTDFWSKKNQPIDQFMTDFDGFLTFDKIQNFARHVISKWFTVFDPNSHNFC